MNACRERCAKPKSAALYRKRTTVAPALNDMLIRLRLGSPQGSHEYSQTTRVLNSMKITIPELSLVVLIGASGAGKSSFARRHFLPTETISSDFCRGLVSDDENSLEATNDAFDVLHYVAANAWRRDV
jgi:ABC-type glutathione transport system ATPase component